MPAASSCGGSPRAAAAAPRFPLRDLVRTRRHAAVFVPTVWTGVFFDSAAVAFGDIVAGPVALPIEWAACVIADIDCMNMFAQSAPNTCDTFIKL